MLKQSKLLGLGDQKVGNYSRTAASNSCCRWYFQILPKLLHDVVQGVKLFGFPRKKSEGRSKLVPTLVGLPYGSSPQEEPPPEDPAEVLGCFATTCGSFSGMLWTTHGVWAWCKPHYSVTLWSSALAGTDCKILMALPSPGCMSSACCIGIPSLFVNLGKAMAHQQSGTLVMAESIYEVPWTSQ